jgi:putative transposase
LQRAAAGEPFKTIDFKGAHFPKAVIVHALFFYVRYAVSYRDLEEILAERGVAVDHATLNRWVVKYSPLIAANAQARTRPTSVSWRMDETYIKVVKRGAIRGHRSDCEMRL